MNEHNHELMLPTMGGIKKLLEPIYIRLDKIDSNIGKSEIKSGQTKYYRNQDLKKVFGLSNNTIIKYRETGILPYTKLGDIFLYEIKIIEAILIKNRVEI